MFSPPNPNIISKKIVSRLQNGSPSAGGAPSSARTLRLLYPDRLVRDPALRIHSGIGGVIYLSVPLLASSSSSRRSTSADSTRRPKSSKLPCRLRGLGPAGRLPLRI